MLIGYTEISVVVGLVNPADPRWLEILKASGWQTTALAVACTLIISLVKIGIIPTDGSSYWIAIPGVGAIVFGCLSLATMASAIVRAIKPGEQFGRWWQLRSEKRSVREYIQYMTDKDKEIIGYLLHHNQKVFQTAQDGGYAAPLISKGIVRLSARHGQVLDPNQVPFEIPDHIWAVLKSNQGKFPYCPPRDRQDAGYPWAIHWMVR